MSRRRNRFRFDSLTAFCDSFFFFVFFYRNNLSNFHGCFWFLFLNSFWFWIPGDAYAKANHEMIAPHRGKVIFKISHCHGNHRPLWGAKTWANPNHIGQTPLKCNQSPAGGWGYGSALGDRAGAGVGVVWHTPKRSNCSSLRSSSSSEHYHYILFDPKRSGGGDAKGEGAGARPKNL